MIKIDMNFLKNNSLVKYFGKVGLRSSLKIFFYFFKAFLRLTTLETGIISGHYCRQPANGSIAHSPISA